MAELLQVELRDSRGKRNARRNRRSGKLPAVLYGHGQETVSLLVSSERFLAAVRHGARLVKLSGAVEDQAFIREIQWDTWGLHALHVDFTRVSEHEKVQVEVTVELRGEAPGAPGLIGAINFSGGAGGDPQHRPGQPCTPVQIERLWRQQAATVQVPSSLV